LKKAWKDINQASPTASNGSVASPTTPTKQLGSKDQEPVVDLMTPLKPTNPAVTLDLTTTPKEDTEADSGETNDDKQGGANSDPSSNKGNGSENEGNSRSNTNLTSGSSPSGDGGMGGEGDTGGNGNDRNGNGGRHAEDPVKGNPGSDPQGSQKKKKRRPRKKTQKSESPAQSSSRKKGLTPPSTENTPPGFCCETVIWYTAQ
jgi:hypothetical protein